LKKIKYYRISSLVLDSSTSALLINTYRSGDIEDIIDVTDIKCEIPEGLFYVKIKRYRQNYTRYFLTEKEMLLSL